MSASKNNLRVVKVGGSLLQLPDLVKRIQHWLASVESRKNVFVMGGGNFCNELRVLHQRFDLAEEISHNLCMIQMTMTSRLLSDLLRLDVVETIDQILTGQHDVVFDSRQWLAMHSTVPKDWSVTSDSISAILATELDCELCLLKSVDTQEVDHYFPIASNHIVQVSFVNLRNDR